MKTFTFKIFMIIKIFSNLLLLSDFIEYVFEIIFIQNRFSRKHSWFVVYFEIYYSIDIIFFKKIIFYIFIFWKISVLLIKSLLKILESIFRLIFLLLSAATLLIQFFSISGSTKLDFVPIQNKIRLKTCLRTSVFSEIILFSFRFWSISIKNVQKCILSNFSICFPVIVMRV